MEKINQKYYWKLTKDTSVMYIMLSITECNRYQDKGWEVKRIW